MDLPAILDINPEAPSVTEVWNHWREGFENFIHTVNLTEDEKLRLLVSCVSPDIYERIRCCRTYKDALTSLNTCFSKPHNGISAQFKLFSRKQKSKESAEKYMESLQALSLEYRFTCETFREDCIRGIFIAGVSSQLVRRRLLENSQLSLAEAVNQAKALEGSQPEPELSDHEALDGNDGAFDGAVSDDSEGAAISPVAKNTVSSLNNSVNTSAYALIKNMKSDSKKPRNTSRKKGEYTCYHCKLKFSYKDYLVKHMLNHFGSTPRIYSCDQCDRKYKRRGDLNRHKILHVNGKPFACELCDYKAACKSHLKRHLRVHTGEKPYACVLCDFRASAKISVVKHVRCHHTGEKPFACTYCEYRFPTRNHLTVHMRKHTGEAPYACQFCGFRARFKNALDLHLLRLHEEHVKTQENKFACAHCDFKTYHKIFLTKHLRKYHKTAPKQNSTHRNIAAHKQNELKLTCDLCGYKAAYKYSMKLHVDRHNGIKNFHCTLCKYSFHTKDLLQMHMAMHTGEKPFKCDVCPFATHRRMHLHKHKKLHTGEKPYSCDICGYRAAIKEYVTAHMKTHTGKRYACEHCSYTTFKKCLLNQHTEMHTREGQVKGQKTLPQQEVEGTTNQTLGGPEILSQSTPTWQQARLQVAVWHQGPSSTAIPSLWSPGKFQ